MAGVMEKRLRYIDIAVEAVVCYFSLGFIEACKVEDGNCILHGIT